MKEVLNSSNSSDFQTVSEEEARKLSLKEALPLLKAYEDLSNTVKGRTWTITTWILALNAGLIAFSFNLFIEHRATPGFLGIVGVVLLVGLALCAFVILLIEDQGKHLKGYWTCNSKLTAWNPALRGIYLTPNKLSKLSAKNYEADFPRFCRRLEILVAMFVCGLIGTFVIITYLLKPSS